MTDTSSKQPDVIALAAAAAATHGMSPWAFTRSVQDVAENDLGWVVIYRTALAVGQVDVSKEPLAVAPSSNWEPIERRSLWTLLTALLVSLGALYITQKSYAQHRAWSDLYSEYDGLAMLTALGLGVCASAVIGQVLLARRARSRVFLVSTMVAVVACLAAAAIAQNADYPSLAAVERAAAEGDHQRAYTMTQVLGTIHMAPPETAALADREHRAWLDDICRALHEARDPAAYDTIVAEMTRVSSGGWFDGASARGAAEHVAQTIDAKLASSSAAKDVCGIEALARALAAAHAAKSQTAADEARRLRADIGSSGVVPRCNDF